MHTETNWIIVAIVALWAIELLALIIFSIEDDGKGRKEIKRSIKHDDKNGEPDKETMNSDNCCEAR